MNSFVPNSALFKVVTLYADNVSISSGATKTTNISLAGVSNYTPIGIVGHWASIEDVGDGDGTGSSYINFYRVSTVVDNNQTYARLIVRNLGSSSAKVRLNVNVLFVHT